jgi:adenine deaminase
LGSCTPCRSSSASKLTTSYIILGVDVIGPLEHAHPNIVLVRDLVEIHVQEVLESGESVRDDGGVAVRREEAA